MLQGYGLGVIFISSGEEEMGLEEGQDFVRATQSTQRGAAVSLDAPPIPACLNRWTCPWIFPVHLSCVFN